MSRGKGSTFSDHEPIRVSKPTATRVLGSRSRWGRKDGIPPARNEEERRCHCGTKLTAYNLGETCYAHSDRKPVRFRPVFRSTPRG